MLASGRCCARGGRIMRRWLAVVLGAVVTAGGLAADDKKELEKFQGHWEIVSSEKDGKKQTALLTREIKGNKYTLKNKDKVTGTGTFKIDPSASPKAIDITREGD